MIELIWGHQPAKPNNGIPTGESGKGQCPFCSTVDRMIFHAGVCPRIKEIVYYPDGTIQRIHLFPAEKDRDK